MKLGTYNQQLITISPYCQFNITSIYLSEVNIILGTTWLKILGTFIINMGKRFLIFNYKKKKATLQRIYNEVMLRSSLIRRP